MDSISTGSLVSNCSIFACGIILEIFGRSVECVEEFVIHRRWRVSEWHIEVTRPTGEKLNFIHARRWSLPLETSSRQHCRLRRNRGTWSNVLTALLLPWTRTGKGGTVTRQRRCNWVGEYHAVWQGVRYSISFIFILHTWYAYLLGYERCMKCWNCRLASVDNTLYSTLTDYHSPSSIPSDRRAQFGIATVFDVIVIVLSRNRL